MSDLRTPSTSLSWPAGQVALSGISIFAPIKQQQPHHQQHDDRRRHVIAAVVPVTGKNISRATRPNGPSFNSFALS